MKELLSHTDSIGGERMDQPHYVLKSMENMREPKDQRVTTAKNISLTIIAVALLGSLIFKIDVFGLPSSSGRMMLVVLFVIIVFHQTMHFVPYPIELRFYDDRIIIIRDHIYYSKKLTRKEVYVFRYAEVERCEFNKSSNLLTIVGQVYVEWYPYNKAGVPPQIPSTTRTCDGICFFYTHADPNVDFVKEIEEHSPIKITKE